MPKKISIFERTGDAFPDPHKTNPVEQPAFKMPSSDAPRKPLKASADASKFLKKIGPQTKLDTPFDKANKEVDKLAAGVHKDTTSVAGRMKSAGIPAPKAGYTAPAKPDSVDMRSPDAKNAYQTARSGGISASTNLDRPAIWRNQETAATGLGKHDHDVAKHSAPVVPKAKTDPIASQSPQGPGSDPIASQKTSAAPAPTPAPSAGSSPMSGAPATKTQAEPAPAVGMAKPGEKHPLKKERQTTPRGNKVAGEPAAPSAPKEKEVSLKPPPAPAGPPPLKMATPEYQAAQNPKPEPKAPKEVKSAEPKAAPAPAAPVAPIKVKSHAGSTLVGAVSNAFHGMKSKAGKLIKQTSRVKNYTR